MKHIVALVFPQHGINTDMLLYSNIEPSILHVIPPDDEQTKCTYIHDHKDIAGLQHQKVLFYLCSVYITGIKEFLDFAKQVDHTKIILGGVQPTMTPEIFNGTYYKLVKGLCNDLYATINQKGDVVEGIMTHQHLPRYDLYQTKWNCQIIPDRQINDSCSSINTSIGCIHNCAFCCTPVLYNRTIYKKPLDFLLNESLLLSQNGKRTFKNVFIRDENLFMLDDWEQRLNVLQKAQLAEKYHCFASADQIKGKAKKIKKQGINLVNLDFGIPKNIEKKNKRFFDVCNECNNEGVDLQISFILDPTTIVDQNEEMKTYQILQQMVQHCRPVMLSGNFLMPFPGTRIAKKYNVGIEDCLRLNLKSAKLLINDERVISRIELNMFQFQLNYFESDLYSTIRHFRCGDVLDLKYQQLSKIFSTPKLKNNFNGIGFEN